MAFLFKSKKNQSNNALPPANRDIHTSEGSKSSIPTVNGIKDKERPGGPVQTTPSSSVNNSLNSLGGAGTPSPEHGSGSRERSEQESQIYRNPSSGTSSTLNPGASLYPWSQRRLTFTTSVPSPFPRYGAAVNSVSSKEGDVYLMGGLVDGSTVKGDLWMVEAGGGSLACYPVPTHSEGPGPRVGHASLLAGNAFIVFGGDTKSDDRDVLDDTLYLLNTSTRQWSRAMPPGPRPAGRYGHTLNILGSKIYVFGGQVEGYFFNDLIAFDLNALQTSGSQWEMLIQSADNGGPPPGQVPPARTNHTVVSYNEKLYLFGGTNGVQWFNDVWTYDPRFNVWSQLDCIGYIPAPREGHSAALVNDVMYIFGGRTEEGTDLGDLAAFRITSRRWYTFQNMGPAPSPRSGHSMTAYGKQIVVLAGEPSSAPRDPGELNLVYVLDTVKIRYPNDQQIQQTPAGERVPGHRRPSGGEKTGIPQSRALLSRDVSNGPPEGLKRMASGGPRESTTSGPTSFGSGQDPSMANGPASTGPGSRLPRASIAQAPPGPPPQQQAPPPRNNGILPAPGAPRSKTPTRPERGFGPPLDTVRATSFEENGSPVPRDGTRESPSLREHSPIVTGRRTPTQQPSRLVAKSSDSEQLSMANGIINELPNRSRSRQDRQQHSLESIEEPASVGHDVHARDLESDQQGRRLGEVIAPAGRGLVIEGPLRSPVFGQRDKSLIEELAVARNRNAWYASELALARKAGYQQSSTQSPVLDERAAQSFGDDDRPLIEALLAMKAELAKVQGSVDSQATLASQRIAEVEQQRDAAVSEAAYAKAKLAAHGGSQTSSPQPDGSSHELRDVDRSTELSKRLASALALQHTLKARVDALNAEVLVERRARELADGTADAAQKRIAELEDSRNPMELESLRARFSDTEKVARDEAAKRAEAESSMKLLQVDNDELVRKLEDVVREVDTHTNALGLLREAVAASSDKSNLLERKLDEERSYREGVERKLLQLKAEHEERTAELENTSRRLRDAEDLGEKHAAEARTHRQAVLSGLEKAGSRNSNDPSAELADQRVNILREQVASTNTLLRENQAAADAACEKLRKAEERIAGLEVYQEQASREGLQIRKQLQNAMRETQSLQAENSDFKQQLETHQRDANALAIQHGALKDLLGERGISAAEARRSRNLDSPGSRFGTPDQVRLRELEQQLESSLRTHQEIKASLETREQEADKAYREKLEQLENDYQSAVHYVKGTEKMLKRMKDELSKYKTQNARMQTELEEAHKQNSERSVDQEGQSEWEVERTSLKREIEEMQEHIKTSVSQLERQMREVRYELKVAQDERDQYRTSSDQAQRHLANVTQQARADLEQLKNENNLLESRALDAEQKVSLLLDQVESSVDNYRRQSQHVQPNGIAGHQRTNSATSALGNRARSDSASQESTYGPDNRNSVALDSLASELETLRTHWETTNRNYRLSSQFDFERTPTSAHGDLSDSLANWRRRLDLEESEPDEAKDATPEMANQRVRRAMSPISKGQGGGSKDVGSDRTNVI